MACDGSIASEEIALLNDWAKDNELIRNLEVSTLITSYSELVKKDSTQFLSEYFSALKNGTFTKEEELSIVKIAIETIEADEQIEYSEIKFFKKIRAYLAISDKEILSSFPDKEDYLLPDINDDEYNFNLTFSKIDITNIK